MVNTIPKKYMQENIFFELALFIFRVWLADDCRYGKLVYRSSYKGKKKHYDRYSPHCKP
jgi:hypothetical protein